VCSGKMLEVRTILKVRGMLKGYCGEQGDED